MGKKGKSSNASKKRQNGQREVRPDVHEDKVAANLLNFKKPEYGGVSKNNKSRNRAISRGKLTTKKKTIEPKVSIPKLNTALDPVGVKVKGKKGKKFVNDTSLQLILAEVQQESNEAHASKLEKARQLEAIRETKRKEIEEREMREKEKIESKKKELRKKGKGSKQTEISEPEPSKKPLRAGAKKKRVSFAA